VESCDQNLIYETRLSKIDELSYKLNVQISDYAFFHKSILDSKDTKNQRNTSTREALIAHS